MFFNYDSLSLVPFVVVSILVGGIFTYNLYNHTTINTPTATYKEVGIQCTPNNESLVNTVQPNLDSMNLAESAYPVLQPNNLHLIDVGTQTPAHSIFRMFKDWLMELFSMTNSIPTPTDIKVEKWIDNLDSTQIISQNDINSVVPNNQLPTLINVGDSISNLGTVTTNAVVDYSQYTFLGEVVVETATNQALIQSVSLLGFC